jgi:hypothetical protein
MENPYGAQLQETALQDGMNRVSRPGAEIQGTVTTPSPFTSHAIFRN